MFLAILESTPDEMLTWRPKSASGDPTSILDIAKHCIAAESMFHAVIRDGGTPPSPEATADWLSAEAFATRGPAADVHDKPRIARLVADLERAAGDLARTLPCGAWEETIETPFMTAPRIRYLRMICIHWSYHAGQAAYIQRLYGDLSHG